MKHQFRKGQKKDSVEFNPKEEKQAEKMFKETEGQAKQLSHVAEKRIEKSISVQLLSHLILLILKRM